MAEDSFELQPEEARLLLNIAMMATGRNLFRSAATILAALEGFRPDSEQVANAKVVLMLSMKQAELAVEYIRGQALAKWPESGMLKAFLGMALQQLGRNDEANQALQEATASSDPAAANLARGLLN